jgi:molybdenum cofactor cytidylyltransferase
MNDPGAGSDGLHVIVLAAGASTRFGSPKQLVRLRGQPLLHRAIAAATDLAGRSVIVVLGCHAAELTGLLRHSSATIVINRDWRDGMASSIRTGVARLPASCGAALLMLADQPAVSGDDLRRLTVAWRREPECMAAAFYDTVLGPPAIFPRAAFRDLSLLHGDTGARALLRGASGKIVRVAMPSAAIDIDTPEDLLALRD